MSIEVVSGREGTFKVTYTATSGSLSTSSLTGPDLGDGGLQLQAEGSIGRTGRNTYSVTSDSLSGQSNGDTYNCTAMNNLSSPEDRDYRVQQGQAKTSNAREVYLWVPNSV